MSGLLITSSRADEMTTPITDVQIVRALDTPPSARRQFARTDEVTVFAEVYDTNRSPHTDVFVTRIVNAAGRVVVEGSETVPSDRVNGGLSNTGYPHKIRLKLNSLQPGSYVLRLEVRPEGKASAAVSREVTFIVS